jgi:hypothetical protein
MKTEPKKTKVVSIDIPESDSGYVLHIRRRGFKSNWVAYRYSREVVEEAKKQFEQEDGVVEVTIIPAAAWQKEQDSKPPELQAHDDWDRPTNAMAAPLITTLEED